MGYRGRLIRPNLVDIAQLDTDATAADPDGGGPLTSGFDDVFGEPVLIPPAPGAGGEPEAGAPRGTLATQYKAAITLKAQIEVTSFDMLRQWAGGQAPGMEVTCVFFMPDLESLGLLDANGEPLIRLNDKLLRIKHLDGTIIQEIRYPPGMYAIRADSTSFGLPGGKRNLYPVTFQDRAATVAAVV